jgi:hypothetical protein
MVHRARPDAPRDARSGRFVTGSLTRRGPIAVCRGTGAVSRSALSVSGVAFRGLFQCPRGPLVSIRRADESSPEILMRVRCSFLRVLRVPSGTGRITLTELA